MSTAAERAATRRHQAGRRQDWKDNGLCQRCGKRPPVTRTVCQECRDYLKQKSFERYRRPGVAEHGELARMSRRLGVDLTSPVDRLLYELECEDLGADLPAYGNVVGRSVMTRDEHPDEQPDAT